MAENVRGVVRLATDLAAPNHRDLATEVGITPLTLSHWRTGRRNPTPANLMELGRVLLSRSRALERVAVDLIRIAAQDASAGHESGVSPGPGTIDLFEEPAA